MANLGELKLDDKFTNINPDELSDELKETYKNMQSHFTKRTQEAVDAKKEFDAGFQNLQTERSAMEARIAELEGANAELQKLKSGGAGDDGDILKWLEDLDAGNIDGFGSISGADSEEVKLLKKTVSAMAEQIDTLKTDIDEKTSRALKVIQYEHDLNSVAELFSETFGKKLDRQRLIDFAIEQKTPDLHQAYREFTRDATIEKKAAEKADTLFKEHLEKQEEFASGQGGSGVPLIFARETEEAPKTMGAATASILKELRTKIAK